MFKEDAVQKKTNNTMLKMIFKYLKNSENATLINLFYGYKKKI